MPPTQLPLFKSHDLPRSCRSDHGPLDAASESLLRTFAHVRSQEGAHPHSVAREVSQARALVRASRAAGGPESLEQLIGDSEALAQVFRGTGCLDRTVDEPGTAHRRAAYPQLHTAA